MAVVALIEPPQAELIEKILSHCGLWRSAAIKAVMQFQIHNKQQTAQCHQFLGYSQLGAADSLSSQIDVSSQEFLGFIRIWHSTCFVIFLSAFFLCDCEHLW